MVERELKIKQHSSQTSTITKLPLPPNNNHLGTSTKGKETWSPNPAEGYWDVDSTPPDRASPSSSSPGPAVSISLLLFGHWTLLVLHCRSDLFPCCGSRPGELAPRAPETAALTPLLPAGQVFVKFSLKQFRVVKCSFLEAWAREGVQRETKGPYLVLPLLREATLSAALWEWKESPPWVFLTLRATPISPISAKLGQDTPILVLGPGA